MSETVSRFLAPAIRGDEKALLEQGKILTGRVRKPLNSLSDIADFSDGLFRWTTEIEVLNGRLYWPLLGIRDGSSNIPLQAAAVSLWLRRHWNVGKFNITSLYQVIDSYARLVPLWGGETGTGHHSYARWILTGDLALELTNRFRAMLAIAWLGWGERISLYGSRSLICGSSGARWQSRPDGTLEPSPIFGLIDSPYLPFLDERQVFHPETSEVLKALGNPPFVHPRNIEDAVSIIGIAKNEGDLVNANIRVLIWDDQTKATLCDPSNAGSTQGAAATVVSPEIDESEFFTWMPPGIWTAFVGDPTARSKGKRWNCGFDDRKVWAVNTDGQRWEPFPYPGKYIYERDEMWDFPKLYREVKISDDGVTLLGEATPPQDSGPPPSPPGGHYGPANNIRDLAHKQLKDEFVSLAHNKATQILKAVDRTNRSHPFAPIAIHAMAQIESKSIDVIWNRANEIIRLLDSSGY